MAKRKTKKSPGKTTSPKRKPGPSRHRANPPSLLQPAVINKILKAIKAGCFLDTAARSAGISRLTVYKWLRIAKKLEAQEGGPRTPEDRQYVSFRQRYLKAKAEAVSTRMERIQRAGQRGDWKADAYVLAKIDYRYKDSKDVNIKKEVTGQIDHQHSLVPIDSLPLEERRKLLELIRQKKAEGNPSSPSDKGEREIIDVQSQKEKPHEQAQLPPGGAEEENRG